MRRSERMSERCLMGVPRTPERGVRSEEPTLLGDRPDWRRAGVAAGAGEVAGRSSGPGEDEGRGSSSLVSLLLLGVERVLRRPGEDILKQQGFSHLGKDETWLAFLYFHCSINTSAAVKTTYTHQKGRNSQETQRDAGCYHVPPEVLVLTRKARETLLVPMPSRGFGFSSLWRSAGNCFKIYLSEDDIERREQIQKERKNGKSQKLKEKTN
ncbi:hypothetical protein E2C01_004101 [Portunus trituberculatus]|uniref:Uncharacterized protein n=1 Tax=Portunus trituberculatus TaxID=210409 RepID=A0A5B7CQG7_PORTR|nr:hypothetical protein [Portunus trituberculatus]